MSTTTNTKIKTLTTYTVTYPVGEHFLPLTVAAANKGHAHTVALPVLRQRIGNPTYSNFPVSTVERVPSRGTGAVAVNPTVVRPKIRTRKG